MAYLHCHNCDFSQDDYWSDNGWNPVHAFERDKNELLHDDLDRILGMDEWWLKENGYKQEEFTVRKSILHHLKQIMWCIEGMIYRTPEELKEKNPDRICPKCGCKTLDED